LRFNCILDCILDLCRYPTIEQSETDLPSSSEAANKAKTCRSWLANRLCESTLQKQYQIPFLKKYMIDHQVDNGHARNATAEIGSKEYVSAQDNVSTQRVHRCPVLKPNKNNYNLVLFFITLMKYYIIPSFSCSIVAVASILRQEARVPCRAANIRIISAVFKQLTFSRVSVSTEMDETSSAK